MGEGQDVPPAIGWYWPSRFDRIVGTIAGLIWILGSLLVQGWDSVVWLAVAVVFLASAWCVPVTTISPTGIRLIRRFTTIRWAEVATVFQPAPGDPVRIKRSDGKLFVLSGVGFDRLPGILALATQDTAEPTV